MKIERYFFGDLELQTAMHIGIGKSGEPTDSPLRRANNRAIVIPGRAIGGSLRTTATRLAPRLGGDSCWALRQESFADLQKESGRKYCGCVVCQLFGEFYPSEDEPDTQNPNKGGRASRLWISDAFAQVNEPQTSVRDGVGIDRVSGAAAHNVKFDYEVVPRGQKFLMRMRLVDDDADGNSKPRAQLLRATLAEWEHGRGRLGSSAPRGLGKFTLTNLGVKQTKISKASELIVLLKRETLWEAATDDAELENFTLPNVEPDNVESDDVAKSFVTVQFDIQLTESFLVNDPLTSALAGFDHAPLLEVNFPKADKPVLSGSSLRGALRTRAERIARTLAMLHWKTETDFLAHCPACNPFAKQEDALASCDARLEISNDGETPEGALCLACQLFGSPRRGSRLWIEDAEWQGGTLNQDSWHAQDFLAIDRFTGGGQEHAKFDAAPLTQAKFQARFTLHNPKAWELGWLVLVLRDLAEGEMTLGFGAAKGYGRVTANEFKWTIGYIAEKDFPNIEALSGEMKREGVYSLKTLPTSANAYSDAWAEQAKAWVKEFNDAVNGFQAESHAEWQTFERDSFLSEATMRARYGMPRVEIKEQTP